jgi:dolichyl-phosphate beta-glucosyltransferase
MAIRYSVVIPAYRESCRLPPYLRSIRSYLDRVFPEAYEVIVVDDGSTDGLAGALQRHGGIWPQLSVLRHSRNLGKGAALNTGMRAASAPFILATDADGATAIEEENGLREAIDRGAAIGTGSRLVRHVGAAVQCLPCRRISGKLFSFLARRLFGLPLRDTQCGFKLFRREVALALLPLCREAGYLLDLEILAWAYRLGYPIVEVPVSWRDVPGSKVHLVRDGWAMLRGLLRMRQSFSRRTLPLGRPISLRENQSFPARTGSDWLKSTAEGVIGLDHLE